MLNVAEIKEITLSEKDVPGASLAKYFSNCNVEELKRWLECHGQKKSGKKPELIDRVRGCTRIGVKVDSKVDGGKWYETKSSDIILPQATIDLLPTEGWGVYFHLGISH